MRLETMDIVNVIYVGHLELMFMALHGVGYGVVTWSSYLIICMYPLVWWFCSFRTLNISVDYPLVFIVSDKNPAVNLTDVPLDVMNHFSLTAFKKSWKKKKKRFVVDFFVFTFWHILNIILCLCIYIDILINSTWDLLSS